MCLGLLAIIVIIMVIRSPNQEGFDLQPLSYQDIGNPILRDYKEKKHPELTDNSSQDIYTNYPVFPAHSCINNNIKYWRRPTNGKCSPAEFCDNLYDNTDQTIPAPLQAPSTSGIIRVNYYAFSNGESCN